MRRWGVLLLILAALLLAGSSVRAERGEWPMQFPQPRFCCHGLLGDLNGDGWVNALDYSVFHSAYGSQEGDAHYNARADLTCDGRVNGDDFDVFKLQYWKRAK